MESKIAQIWQRRVYTVQLRKASVQRLFRGVSLFSHLFNSIEMVFQKCKKMYSVSACMTTKVWRLIHYTPSYTYLPWFTCANGETLFKRD